MKRAVLVISALFLLDHSALMASTGAKGVAECAVVAGDLESLQCFDGIAGKFGLDGPQQVEEVVTEAGKWNVSVGVNPIDDSKTVMLQLKADEGRGSYGNPVYLIARCQSNETDVYIRWNSYLGRRAKVLSRVGNQPALTKTWSLSTDSKATFDK